MRWAVVAGLAGMLVAPVSGEAVSFCDGSGYIVTSASNSGPSTLVRFDPATGVSTVIKQLSMHLNAVGSDGDVLYGIAMPGAHPVRITTDGKVTQLRQILDAPPYGFASAYSATIHSGHWYLLREDTIYTVALVGITAPRVVATQALQRPVSIGDWAADAAGKLLAVDTSGKTAHLVSIDPLTGRVSTLADPAGLPASSAYGAVWVIGEQLYLVHNLDGSVYRVDLTDPGTATKLATTTHYAGSDGAGCAAPPVPASPSPSPPASPTPSPVPSPTPSPTSTPPPSPTPSHAAPAQPAPIPPRPAPPAELPVIAAPPPPLVAPTPSDSPVPARAPSPKAPIAAPMVFPVKPVEPAERRDRKQRTRKWVAATAMIASIGGLLGARGMGGRR